jgi:GT2 family glycosyltransferase
MISEHDDSESRPSTQGSVAPEIRGESIWPEGIGTSPHIGILSYETRDVVLENVANLIRSGIEPEEIAVLDNASLDGTVDALRARFPRVATLQSPTNRGYAGGMNRLVESLTGSHLVLLTADCFTDRESVARVLTALVKTKSLAACGGMIVDGRTGRVQSVGGTIAYPLGMAMHYFQHRRVESAHAGLVEVAYIDGAFFGVNRELFRSLGGFDESYFAYHEEVDFCWRARLHGYSIASLDSARANHRTYASFRDPQVRWRLSERNRIRTNVKNLEPVNLAASIAMEAAYGPAVVLGSLIFGVSGGAKSYVSAVSDVWKTREGLRMSRRTTQSGRLVPDSEVLRLHERRGLIAVLRHLNRQRRYFYSGAPPEDTAPH